MPDTVPFKSVADAPVRTARPAAANRPVGDGSTISLPDGATIGVVRLGSIHIPSYQRAQRTVGSYKKIRNRFNVRLYDVLVLSRRADGTLWVIDGLQRRDAREDLEGPGTLVFARIISNLTVSDEVELFEHLNKDRVRVSKFAMLHAQKEAGEPEAIALFLLVESVQVAGGHLTLSQSHGNRLVGSPDQLARIMKWPDGPSILRNALETCALAWGPNSGTFHGSLVSGMAAFYRLAGEQGLTISRTEMAARLREGRYARSARDITGPVGGVSAKSGGGELVAAVLAYTWNAGRHGSRYKITIPGHLVPFLRSLGMTSAVALNQAAGPDDDREEAL